MGINVKWIYKKEGIKIKDNIEYKESINKLTDIFSNNSSDIKDDFFEQLKKDGIKVTEEQREQINVRLKNVLTYEPRIGILGKTGAGKSSLCNALFGKDICPISDVEACTRNTKEVVLNLGESGIKLIDVPGVGESSSSDKEYASLYAKLLPELDLVLWLIKSDDRAFAPDENFYKNIVKPYINEGKPFFFVLNQVDKIEPFREWHEEKHEPGAQQFQNIYRKIDDVAQYFNVAPSKIIPVSAKEKYNLTKLVDEFIRALPAEKKITVFKDVDKEFQSKATGEHVKKSLLEVIGDVVITTINNVGNVVCTTIETAGRIIESAGQWIINYLPLSKGSGGGCYITTATCKELNKSDDCYELNQFRKFRDEWLLHQPDGEELIKKYYKDAPIIVDRINLSSNHKEIYEEINEKYLKPCLSMIENNKFVECKELYTNMINNLSDKYLL